MFLVVRYVCTGDPKGYNGGSIATGRLSVVGQVDGWTCDEEEQCDSPGLGLGRRASTTIPIKYLSVL